MGGTVLGEFLGVQKDKWWNKTSRLTTHNNKKHVEILLKKERKKALLRFIADRLMTWKFLYVTGLKAQLALPHVSFTKQCQCRLIDIIKGQVSLIYEAGILWSKSYTV